MDQESEEQREKRTRALWDKFDTKDQESLDLSALKKGLKKLDHPLQNADNLIEEVIKAADVNHDGRIRYDEFRKFVHNTESHLWSLFQNIDRDHDGKLDKNELGAAFTRAGLAVPDGKLNRFFKDVDRNNDGAISFAEWRDFLLFMPPQAVGLKAVISYHSSTVKVNPEGDVSLSDEAMISLASRETAPFTTKPPPVAVPEVQKEEDVLFSNSGLYQTLEHANPREVEAVNSPSGFYAIVSLLTQFIPDPGYFLAGGISGVASRTTTAPLDRLKVYLIARTDAASEAVSAARSGAPLAATKQGASTLVNACKDLWAAGGMRSLFAGNGINIIKVMPESAVKFGSYEASKRVVAQFEGHNDTKKINNVSQFVAGGIAGMISQAVVYPLDTLKFRMQNETVKGGLHGNALIIETAKKMWAKGGMMSFYRGLSMGLVGMFPYAAIDLGTFEYLKRTIVSRKVAKYGCTAEEALPNSFTLALMGGFSGAFGATVVYPINLLRTRLQCQGTVAHPRTYNGIADVTRQTLKGEGVRGLFKGLTPNLLKVIPAVSITYVVYENTKRALHLT
ncbi:hypothetical protein MBLNU457_5448t1 [Dothideomycetes sp. NU457]